MHALLIELSPEECAELLAVAPLGRLGVIVDGRPQIFPVNHAYDTVTGHILVPTNVGTKFRAALAWPWVALEVDSMDDEGSGWSVLVVGHAEEFDDPGVIARAASERSLGWTAGGYAHWLRIVPGTVTGRRIARIG